VKTLDREHGRGRIETVLNSKRRIIDRDNRYGQVRYAFRIGGANPGRFLIELIAMPMVSMMTFGFIPLALLLFGVNLVPDSWEMPWFMVTATLVVASVPLSWTFGNESFYDADREEFTARITLLGHPVRTWSWPNNLFTGISWGNKGQTRGCISVVRLRCIIDGYLVDSFLYADHKEEAREMAARLSEISGLPLLGEEFTGSQHDLNDLRRHAWLTVKYGKSKCVSAAAGD
jgi:hypothetical protein